MNRARWVQNLNLLIAAAWFAGVPLSAPAQGWKPEQPVEFIVACAPGCGPDAMVRLMQRVFQTNRYFDTPMTIQNKAGGGGAVVRTYLNQFDVVPVSVGSWEPHMKTNAVRVIAVSSAERLPGLYSGIPTWREQGANAMVFNWRAMFGPKGMPATAVAYWERSFQRLVETPEWKAELAKRSGVAKFMGAAPMKKYMEEDYADIKAFLVELEMAKK